MVGGSYQCVDGAGVTAPDAARSDAPSDGIDAPADAATPHWMLVQTTASEQGTVAINPTGDGDLIVVAIQTSDTNTVAGIIDDAANTYALAPGTRAVSAATMIGVELWYAEGASAGATTLQIDASPLYSVIVWEVAGVRTTGALDTGTNLDDQPASTTPTAAAITTAGDGDFVVSVAMVANTVSGLKTGSLFTNDHRTHANGWAHLTSAFAPAGTYQAVWNQPTSGEFCGSSAAFFATP